MKIGIIGTGNMGSGLGRQFTGAGHDVFVGSRDAQKGKSVGAEIGASGGSYQDGEVSREALRCSRAAAIAEPRV